MAINWAHSRMQLSKHWEVATGQFVTDEGVALTVVNDAGVAKVQPSTGSGSSEVFAGVSINYVTPPAILPYAGTLAAVGTTLTLPFTPVSGQVNLYDTTSSTQLAIGSASNAGEFSVSGNTVTLNAAQSGHTMRVVLAYTPTVQQAMNAYGEGFPGMQSSIQLQGTIGCVTRGTIATTFFDAAATWTVGAPVRLASNGRFTQGGTSTILSNVICAAAPFSQPDGYLVVELL